MKRLGCLAETIEVFFHGCLRLSAAQGLCFQQMLV